MKLMYISVIGTLAALGTVLTAAAEPLTLARDGKTEYVIVTADDATPVDRYAAKQLALYLQPMTGADFAVVPAAELASDQPALFVGLSAPAVTRLDEPDPLNGWVDDTHVYRSHGQDVFLYGQGVHGNLYAVMGFLEDKLGWRWFSRFEYPLVPAHPVLTLNPFECQRGFSFSFRSVDIQRGFDFPYQQGANQRFEARLGGFALRAGKPLPPRASGPYISRLYDLAKRPHSLFTFVPPTPSTRGADLWPWLPKTNYFAAHPEYFTLWETGKRVPDRQLCFSNPEMRAVFTRNVLATIEQIGEPCVLTIAAQDNPGRFCYCPECQALEAKYSSVGGPLYDYLFEICALLAKQHPEVRIHTLAYRRAQTQKPPRMPEGQTLPSNLIVEFAPIEDNYFADWSHPDSRIQETHADLQAWGRIVHPGNLWAWLYPNGWGTGFPMPVGNVKRTVTNMRMMHAAGVNGVHLDHLIHQRALFSELREYLILKLMQDIEVDPEALIKEFTAYMYGPAATLFRQFLDELETARLAMIELPPGVSYRSPDYDERTFPYLTPENIHRWQGLFDEMLRLTEDGAEVRWRTNVMLARRELDTATLWKWFALREAHPDIYTNHQNVMDRIAAANATEPPPPPAWETRTMNRRWSTHPHGDAARHFATIIRGGGVEKPLPERFKEIAPERIRTLVPTRYRGSPATIEDPDAARGYAVVVDSPGPPDVAYVSYGVHQAEPKERLASHRLDLKDIHPGEYHLFELGEFTMSPSVSVYVGRSWQTRLYLGELYEPGGENRWQGWISIKCDGPGVGGEGPENLVLVDRVILINLSRAQFESD